MSAPCWFCGGPVLAPDDWCWLCDSGLAATGPVAAWEASVSWLLEEPDEEVMPDEIDEAA